MCQRRQLCIAFLVLCLVTMGIGQSVAAKTHHPVVADQNTDPVFGLWNTEDHDGVIDIYACGDSICGRIYWIKDNEADGSTSRDTRNPDEGKRSRPLCGLTLLTGFKADGKGGYNDGSIYSPRHGKDFSADMTLVDHDTLDLRGYLLTSFFGLTQTWKRATGDIPRCSITNSPTG